ncbi:Mediator of RNA polymerase II transcription subunit 6 [Podila epigama]|nr:Mediator of RNA polymerase II transcription subunit 6 [Podila epigama]
MAAAGTMAGGPSETKVDLMNIEWRFQEWLIGMGGLNPDNVLDYFALSPFWDPECNNAVLKMQTQFNNLGEMKQRLSEMTGIEFALVLDRYPTLFIIQKQRRKSPQEVKPMAIYYVLHGNIFQCPDLQTLLSNRVLGSLHHVQSAFNEARNMSEFHPSTGYQWKTEEVPTASGASAPTLSGFSTSNPLGATGSGSGTHKAAESQEFRTAVDRAIRNTEQRLHMQQALLQAGTVGAMGASGSGTGTGIGLGGAGGVGSKVKSEPGTPSSASGSGTPTTKSAPKAATKRRKKSEEASAAAASMGINTSVSTTGNQQGRPPLTGGPATPATPTTATPTKRRKKTKVAADAK